MTPEVGPTVETLFSLLGQMEGVNYGERVNMLEHSLQTAARAADAGASDHLVAAALLHDVGHLLGDAGDWGLPTHAEVGARYLESLLPPDVTEPIRLHVEAKRALVSLDPSYHDRLSPASVESLREQGGPASATEARAFAGLPYADDAMALRSFDDDGKTEGLVVHPPSHYRPLIERLAEPAISAAWARHSCACVACLDPANGQRLVDIAAFEGLHVVATSREDSELLVTVRDGHGELHECRVPDDRLLGRYGREPWGRHPSRPQRRDGDGDLRDFTHDLSRRGIALATGLLTEPGTVLDFASRIGHVRQTNYGDLFDVRTDPNPINLAYTSKGLPLHTDNPYRDPVPTVQLLHCLVAASSGGASRFADGFQAADQLRVEHPEDFDVLTHTPVSFRFASDGVDLRAVVPLIQVEPDGIVSRVTINNRSMQPPVPDRRTDAFYLAYRRFVQILALTDHSIDLTLAAGEVVAFDNRRVLHGRSGYAADPSRHLQGCYIDIDSVHSTANLRRT